MLALWKISGEATCRNSTCTCADLHGRVWERWGMCRQTGEEMAWKVMGAMWCFSWSSEHQQMSSSFIRLRTGTFVITVAVTFQTTLHQTASGCEGAWAQEAAGQASKTACLVEHCVCPLWGLLFQNVAPHHSLYQQCSRGGLPEELNCS